MNQDWAVPWGWSASRWSPADARRSGLAYRLPVVGAIVSGAVAPGRAAHRRPRARRPWSPHCAAPSATRRSRPSSSSWIPAALWPRLRRHQSVVTRCVKPVGRSWARWRRRRLLRAQPGRPCGGKPLHADGHRRGSASWCCPSSTSGSRTPRRSAAGGAVRLAEPAVPDAERAWAERMMAECTPARGPGRRWTPPRARTRGRVGARPDLSGADALNAGWWTSWAIIHGTLAAARLPDDAPVRGVAANVHSGSRPARACEGAASALLGPWLFGDGGCWLVRRGATVR